MPIRCQHAHRPNNNRDATQYNMGPVAVTVDRPKSSPECREVAPKARCNFTTKRRPPAHAVKLAVCPGKIAQARADMSFSAQIVPKRHRLPIIAEEYAMSGTHAVTRVVPSPRRRAQTVSIKMAVRSSATVAWRAAVSRHRKPKNEPSPA